MASRDHGVFQMDVSLQDAVEGTKRFFARQCTIASGQQLSKGCFLDADATGAERGGAGREEPLDRHASRSGNNGGGKA